MTDWESTHWGSQEEAYLMKVRRWPQLQVVVPISPVCEEEAGAVGTEYPYGSGQCPVGHQPVWSYLGQNPSRLSSIGGH